MTSWLRQPEKDTDGKRHCRWWPCWASSFDLSPGESGSLGPGHFHSLI